jgi:hypothetical protein
MNTQITSALRQQLAQVISQVEFTEAFMFCVDRLQVRQQMFGQIDNPEYAINSAINDWIAAA